MNNKLKPSIVALAVAQALALSSAQAKIVHVTTLGDDGAGCTLREAVATINAGSDIGNDCGAGTGSTFGVDDTISFAYGVDGDTIGLVAGEIELLKSVSINPTGYLTTIDANFNSRIFVADTNGTTINLSKLRLIEGYTTLQGAAVIAGGANLNIEDCEITNNFAAGSFSEGGAIAFLGSSTTMSIANSQIVGNQAGNGGGLLLSAGVSNINNSTISGNSAASGSSVGDGGGILGDGTATVNITNSTISSNRSQNGGGIYFKGNLLNVTNSTVSGNRATFGGGVNAYLGPTVNINNSTFSGNTSTIGGADIYAKSSSTTVNITNSIAANLSGGSANCSSSSATVNAGVDSIIESDSCGTSAMNVDPAIGYLADNGGPTMTHALVVGSAAIDGATGAGATTADQRGFVASGTRDIGAFEYGGLDPNFTLNLTVDSTADDNGAGCTLREAIAVVNQRINLSNGCGFPIGPSSGETTIDFDNSLTDATISLTGTKLDILKDVIIDGGDRGITISGNSTNRAFSFDQAGISSEIRNLTISDAGAAAIAVTNGASLNLANMVVSNNSTNGIGGGVVATTNATVQIENSSFSGNSSSSIGGALFVQSGATISASEITVAGNTASSGGGIGVGLDGTLNLSNSTVSGNSAGSAAAIYAANGTTTILNSTLSDNIGVNGSLGDLRFRLGGSATMRNTIVANSQPTVPACSNDAVTLDIDNSNIIEDGTCSVTALSGDPNLGPLQDNGGDTLTHALLPGSIALGAGDGSVCAGDPVNNLDQRGVTRPQGTACDIGAVERIDNPPTVANPTGDLIVDEDDEPETIDLGTVFEDIDMDEITLSVFANDNPALLSTSITGTELTLTFLPDQNGSALITIRATANGKTVDDQFMVTVNPVNDSPIVVNPLGDEFVDEDDPGIVIDLSDVFEDVDGDEITVEVFNNTNEGLVFTEINDFDLTLNFSDDEFGEADITIRATASGETVDNTFTVIVGPVDDPPIVISPIADVDVNEDDSPTSIDISEVFLDIDSDDLMLSLESNSNPLLLTPSLLGTELTLTYLPDQNGSAEITIRATTDGESVDDIFTVTVNPINDPPVFTSSNTLEFEDGESAVDQVTATDVEMDAVTFMLNGGEDASLFDLTEDGVLSFLIAPEIDTPLDFDNNNEYEIIVQAFDGEDMVEQAVTILPASDDECTFFSIPVANSKVVVICL